MVLKLKLLMFFYLIHTLNCTRNASYNHKNIHLRNKRHVVFPMGGTFKIVIGFGIPVKLGLKQSMAIGWNFQFQYPTPTNSSALHEYPPIIARDRTKRGFQISDRTKFYSTLESILNRNGIDGRSCLLRTICENAIWSLDHHANGIFGQLLHTILTPTNGGDANTDSERDILEAKMAGQFGVDCESLYSTCRRGYGLLDSVSVLDV